MEIHTLKSAEGARKRQRRLGRGTGSGIGKTSGKGTKGQNSRSGGGVRPGFEGGQIPLIRRLPKVGFNNKRFEREYTIINVSDLEVFKDGEKVNAQSLLEKRVIRNVEKYGIKVLGNGNLTKKLTVTANKFSGSAKEKIEKVGGRAEEA